MRYLQTGAVNPLVMEPEQAERVSAAFAQIAARLPDRQALQLYVQATPLELEELLADESHRCEQAAGAAQDAGADRASEGDPQARRRSGAVDPRQRAERSRRWRCATSSCARGGRRAAPSAQRTRAARGGSARSCTSETCASRCATRRACAPTWKRWACAARDARPAREVLDLLTAALTRAATRPGECPRASCTRTRSRARSPASSRRRRRARRALAQAICSAPVVAGRARAPAGRRIARAGPAHLAASRADMARLAASPDPGAAAVHAQRACTGDRALSRADGAEAPLQAAVRRQPRSRAARAAAGPRRAAGRGGGSRADRGADARAPGPGSTASRSTSRCATPRRTRSALAELAGGIAREVTMACDARVQHGPFAQERLWRSTLPLGRDVARRSRKYVEPQRRRQLPAGRRPAAAAPRGSRWAMPCPGGRWSALTRSTRRTPTTCC